MMTSCCPSPSRSLISSWLGANFSISAIRASSNRSRGKATSLYSSVSAMRPTRSCCFTSKYLPLICSRVVSFCGGVVVLDDLEHIGEGGQIETQHDHALDAGGDAELVGAVAQVVQKVAVKQGLALLGQT